MASSIVCVVDTEFVKVRGVPRLASLSIVPVRSLTLPGPQWILPEHNFYFNPWVDPDTNAVAVEEMEAALKRPRNNVDIAILSRSASFKAQLGAVASVLNIYSTPLARAMGAPCDCPIIVAHNARHDRDLLYSEFRRAGRMVDVSLDTVWVCSMRMLRRADALMPGVLWPNSRTISLGEWHKRAMGGKTLFNAHDANADARALSDVLRSTLTMIVTNPSARMNEAWSVLALGALLPSSESHDADDDDEEDDESSLGLVQHQQCDSDTDAVDGDNSPVVEAEAEEQEEEEEDAAAAPPVDCPDTVRITMFVQKKRTVAKDDPWKGLKTYQGKWLTASPFPTTDTFTTCVFEFDPKRIMTVTVGGQHTKLSEMYASGLYDAVEMGSGTSCSWRVFSPECIRDIGVDAPPTPATAPFTPPQTQ